MELERREGPHDRRRRKHRHETPIPDRRQHPVKYRILQLRWKAALWSAVYPVQIAAAIAIAACAIPVVMLIEQSQTLHQQQAAIQASRAKVAAEICHQLDINARTENAQLSLFQRIIVGGAQQSRMFDKLYRQYHGPSYGARLKSARRQARDIDRLRLKLPNCSAAILQVRQSNRGR